ncbi:MAG: hypothetical protein OHK0046_14540 [Anaerolineae bacterium]
MNTDTVVDLSKYIEARLFGERPHIRDRRIPVAQVVRRKALNNLTVEETAEDFALSVAEILAALLYYEEYKALIDAQEVEEDRLFTQLEQEHKPE